MKLKKIIIISLLILITVVMASNMPVITKQGIDGVVIAKEIPLYVKACGFLYRDYQYKDLSRRITEDLDSDEEKIMAIYKWTTANIKDHPSGFMIIDDHIWNTVVRRYGTADQKAEVFTTLINYAGYESFKTRLSIKDVAPRLILSFVKIDGNWRIFDIYGKIYFTKEEDLEAATPYGLTYKDYLETFDIDSYSRRVTRADKQKVIPRMIYETKKIFKRY